MNISNYISWKRVKYSIIWLLLTSESVFAAGAFTKSWTSQSKPTTSNNEDSGLFNFDFTEIIKYATWIFYAILWWIFFWYIFVPIIRFIFELYYAKNLRYLKVTVPRADSKLDKEKETKKDFKEKIWMMSMFYKAIHKLSEAWLKDTVLNGLFRHSKISLELVYENWEVTFYVVTYKNYVNLVTQHLTSIYTDAEVLVVDKEDYIDIKPQWYSMRAASLWKEHDDVYPIKTFKYLEDDPLNNFSNVFGGLHKEDKAVFQLVIKPDFDHNKKALNAARLVAKWQYGKKRKKIFWFLSFL